MGPEIDNDNEKYLLEEGCKDGLWNRFGCKLSTTATPVVGCTEHFRGLSENQLI
jgi:hypothetical protein